MNKFTKWAAGVIIAIVAGGWIYGLTSKNSDIVQAFKNAGPAWNIAGVVWLLSGAFVVSRLATGKWGTGKDNRDVILNIIISAVTVLGALFLAAGFNFGR